MERISNLILAHSDRDKLGGKYRSTPMNPLNNVKIMTMRFLI